MTALHSSLSEKDRRRYAATEALQLGRGAISYVCKLFCTSSKTVARGTWELGDAGALAMQSIRRPGGGRKRIVETCAEINELFFTVLREHTAGSPMDERIKWTNLKREEIAKRLAEEGCKVSVTVVDQLLKKHDYRKRKAQKRLPGGTSEHRNEQFLNIKRLICDYHSMGNPVMSMDTKKKEHIGNLYRDGQLFTKETVLTFDHDFPSLADGVIVPHSLYDLFQNVGYVTLGTSRDTSKFACDSIRSWWYEHGRADYSVVGSILLLCDSGGSNNARHHIFKHDLQILANEIGIEIRIAHYPPYTSKYNPIEHRLFPHLTRACRGVIFMSTEIVKKLMEKATTKKGLRVFAHIIDKDYKTKRKAPPEFVEHMPIVRDNLLPQWNYTVIPNQAVWI
jgi:hypothetical protein